jgi:hypothetical protein
LDRELQQYYDERFSLFATKGWQELLEDLEAMLEQYEDITKIPDEQTLWYRKGQVDILQYLLNLKKLTEQTYEELSNENT